jgi:hypothetical protein
MRSDVDVRQEFEKDGGRPANGISAGDAGEPLHGPVPGHNDERGVGYNDAIVQSVDEASG